MPTTLKDVLRANAAVLERRYDPGLPLHAKIEKYPYHGFVEVRIGDAPSFLMLSNNDDIVAQHFLYAQEPGFEQTSLRLWCHLARDAEYVMDVGAFTGVFSLAAASASPNALVHAFEPAGNTYHRLVTNIWANELYARIAPLNFALGATHSRGNIRHPFGVYVLGSGESLLTSTVKDAWYTEDVEIVPGDQLERLRLESPRRFIVERTPGRLGLVKIDVEGYEVEVLRGMSNLIERDRPVLLIEAWDEASVKRVADVLGRAYQHHFVEEASGTLHRSIPRFLTQFSRNVLFHPSRGYSLEQKLAGTGIRID